MTASLNLGFFGGICRSPSCRMAWINKLFFASPDTTAGPVSPPRRKASRESNRSPPLSFVALAEWHSKQFASRTGWILSRKSFTPVSSSAPAAVTWKSAVATRQKGNRKELFISPDELLDRSAFLNEAYRSAEGLHCHPFGVQAELMKNRGVEVAAVMLRIHAFVTHFVRVGLRFGVRRQNQHAKTNHPKQRWL